MGLKWNESLEIAILLDEKYPEVNVEHVRFTDLRDWVQALDEFDDAPEHCGERLLEAIQMCWIEERD